MTFKIGQKVRVKKKEVIEEIISKPEYTEDTLNRLGGMDEWLDKVVTLARDLGGGCWKIEDDGYQWYWNEAWFTELVEVECATPKIKKWSFKDTQVDIAQVAKDAREDNKVGFVIIGPKLTFMGLLWMEGIKNFLSDSSGSLNNKLNFPICTEGSYDITLLKKNEINEAIILLKDYKKFIDRINKDRDDRIKDRTREKGDNKFTVIAI